MSAKVSIITPTLHREPRIVARCIGCVREQTYENWEHILCSDGEFESPIHSLVLAEESEKLTYHHTSKAHNDYGYGVRKEMVENATGDYLVFYDDDNVIMPSYLARMVEALESAENDEPWAICRILHFGPLQDFWGKPPKVLTGVPPKLYHIDTLQIMIRTEVFKQAGFQGELGYFTDGQTYEEFGNRFKWIEVPECLAIHL